MAVVRAAGGHRYSLARYINDHACLDTPRHLVHLLNVQLHVGAVFNVNMMYSLTALDPGPGVPLNPP